MKKKKLKRNVKKKKKKERERESYVIFIVIQLVLSGLCRVHIVWLSSLGHQNVRVQIRARVLIRSEYYCWKHHGIFMWILFIFFVASRLMCFNWVCNLVVFLFLSSVYRSLYLFALHLLFFFFVLSFQCVDDQLDMSSLVITINSFFSPLKTNYFYCCLLWFWVTD